MEDDNNRMTIERDSMNNDTFGFRICRQNKNDDDDNGARRKREENKENVNGKCNGCSEEEKKKIESESSYFSVRGEKRKVFDHHRWITHPRFLVGLV